MPLYDDKVRAVPDYAITANAGVCIAMVEQATEWLPTNADRVAVYAAIMNKLEEMGRAIEGRLSTHQPVK